MSSSNKRSTQPYRYPVEKRTQAIMNERLSGSYGDYLNNSVKIAKGQAKSRKQGSKTAA